MRIGLPIGGSRVYVGVIGLFFMFMIVYPMWGMCWLGWLLFFRLPYLLIRNAHRSYRSTHAARPQATVTPIAGQASGYVHRMPPVRGQDAWNLAARAVASRTSHRR